MLEWAPQSENIMSYSDALLYCLFLEYGGHRDWRLPTSRDLIDENILCSFWVDDDNWGKYAYVKPVRNI